MFFEENDSAEGPDPESEALAKISKSTTKVYKDDEVGRMKATIVDDEMAGLKATFEKL